MNIKIAKFTYIALLFALVLLVLPGMSSAVPVDVFLRVETTTVTMPDATVVPVWGFAQCTDGTYTTCGAATIPGPRITAVEGDDLTINVQNTLVNVPVSVVIPGQMTAMTPVWIDIADPYGAPTGTGSRPADVTSRVRSFTHETAAGGGTNSYTWTGVKAGTYIYQSGTHPALQVQMGLYGALTVDTTGGEAYTGVPYDTEVVIFYSELDPVFHGGVSDTGPVYPSTNVYKPRYFLVNGMPYAAGDVPIPAGNVGQNVLVRFLNAGLDTHMPMVKGSDVSIVAEDGYLSPHTRPSYSVQLPAGKTVDAIFTPQKYGTYPILDRRLYLVNSMQSPGGMLTSLGVTPNLIPSTIGVFSAGTWYVDMSGNHAWDGDPPDSIMSFGGGLVSPVPVPADWRGDGNIGLGIYSGGTWYIDFNNTSAWEGEPADKMYTFDGGVVGGTPVIGDWDGDGSTNIGIYLDGTWYLDANGSGTWDGAPDDAQYSFGAGLVGALPVTGDWDGDGATEIGVYDSGVWYLDLNGNGAWDGTPTDAVNVFGAGLVGAVPVAGDWGGIGASTIGVFLDGSWYVDLNGNGAWDGEPTDSLYSFGGGLVGAVPVTAK